MQSEGGSARTTVGVKRGDHMKSTYKARILSFGCVLLSPDGGSPTAQLDEVGAAVAQIVSKVLDCVLLSQTVVSPTAPGQ